MFLTSLFGTRRELGFKVMISPQLVWVSVDFTFLTLLVLALEKVPIKIFS